MKLSPAPMPWHGTALVVECLLNECKRELPAAHLPADLDRVISPLERSITDFVGVPISPEEIKQQPRKVSLVGLSLEEVPVLNAEHPIGLVNSCAQDDETLGIQAMIHKPGHALTISYGHTMRALTLSTTTMRRSTASCPETFLPSLSIRSWNHLGPHMRRIERRVTRTSGARVRARVRAHVLPHRIPTGTCAPCEVARQLTMESWRTETTEASGV